MPIQSEPRFKIGTKFKTGGKHPRLSTVIDVHRTYSAVTGELVKLRYVSTHEFLGQQVHDYDVVDTTIARGLVSQPE